MVAARMAFKESYSNIVNFNKHHQIKFEWKPSLGHDKDGRDLVLAEAVRLGRITAEHAINLLPPDKVSGMLEAAGDNKLALEYKAPSSGVALENIRKMKEMLAKKKDVTNV
jgi:hypothetical protein